MNIIEAVKYLKKSRLVGRIDTDETIELDEYGEPIWSDTGKRVELTDEVLSAKWGAVDGFGGPAYDLDRTGEDYGVTVWIPPVQPHGACNPNCPLLHLIDVNLECSEKLSKLNGSPFMTPGLGCPRFVDYLDATRWKSRNMSK